MDNKARHIEYLGDAHFAATLALAFALHLLAVFGYYMAPHTKVIDIPVRALNIRLGDTDVQMQEEQAAPQPTAPNNLQVEDSMTKLMRAPVPDKSPMREKPKEEAQAPAPAPKPALTSNVGLPRQFVRSGDRDRKTGSTIGNSTASTAEIKSRYEQTISLWIEKFKLYPDEARAAAMQGGTAVRIRIDRRGNIRYSALERSTGYGELDRAALDMVRRANPVPAVPNDYPDGEMFEFLIPVNFQLQ